MPPCTHTELGAQEIIEESGQVMFVLLKSFMYLHLYSSIGVCIRVCAFIHSFVCSFIHPFNKCLLSALLHARNYAKSRAYSEIYRKDLCSQGGLVISALKKIKQRG